MILQRNDNIWQLGDRWLEAGMHVELLVERFRPMRRWLHGQIRLGKEGLFFAWLDVDDPEKYVAIPLLEGMLMNIRPGS
jgi:hypothetical protein